MLVTEEDVFGLLAVLPGRLGLTDADVARWEAAAGVPFADDFRRLLRLTGGSMRWLFPNGLDHPSDIPTLRREAAELDGTSWELGPADIVFELLDQGDGFWFLRPEGRKSRVFYYHECATQPTATGLTLGLHLVGVLERYLAQAGRSV
jgi:hypothetical protein